jgi:hypothetical protein
MKKVYQFDRHLSHRQSLKLSSGFEIVIKRRQANHLSCHLSGVWRFAPNEVEGPAVLAGATNPFRLGVSTP